MRAPSKAGMTKHLLICVVSAALVAAVGTQDLKQFEVASVRASQEQEQGTGQVGLRITNQQVRIVALPLRDYIASAYQLRNFQIDGPEWLTKAKFDIAATLPAGATQREVPAMLQALLANRFMLKAHRESREFPVYVLEVANGGLKLARSKIDPAAVPVTGVAVAAAGSNRGLAIDLGGGSSYSFAAGKFEGHKLTMTRLAEALNNLLERPVLDQTKTDGEFDVSFEVTPEDYQAMLVRAAVNNGVVLPPIALRALENGSSASLVDAMRAAGLSLQPRRAPLDVLVIDSVERTPSDN
jgi:uncharacterized protein (TIGR03435 family)